MAMDDLDTGWDEAPNEDVVIKVVPKAAPTLPSPPLARRAPMPPLGRPVSYAPTASRPPRAPLSSPVPPPTYARLTSQVATSRAEASSGGPSITKYDIEPPVSSGVVASASPELTTALEEVDFFIAQGLIGDARTLLLEQLLHAPRHPAIVARLTNISSGPASSRTRAG